MQMADIQGVVACDRPDQLAAMEDLQQGWFHPGDHDLTGQVPANRQPLVGDPDAAVDQLELWEKKRRYNARFLNCFETIPDGTRFTVRGEIHLKGWARLLQPFLQGYVRRQMRQLQLQPVKAEAEARAADAFMRNRGDDGARGP